MENHDGEERGNRMTDVQPLEERLTTTTVADEIARVATALLMRMINAGERHALLIEEGGTTWKVTIERVENAG